jgi:plastocyanin
VKLHEYAPVRRDGLTFSFIAREIGWPLVPQPEVLPSEFSRVSAGFTLISHPGVNLRRVRSLLVILAGLLLATAARAGDLTVSVRDASGRPVRDAVVTVHPAAGAPRAAVRFPWALRMAQQNVDFDPYVLIVPVGGTVSFPNLDRVRHQVYSFSRGNRFELPLYSRGDAPTHTFAAVGVAALGCNIHDDMLAYIKVVDTPWAAKTDASGQATLRGVPAGAATLRVWHPRLAGRGNEVAQTLTVGAGAATRAITGDFTARAALR